MRRSTHGWGLLACALCATGCAERAIVPATDTGNPFNEGGNPTNGEGGGACDASATPIELDAETPLGFGARSVLGFAEGEHVLPLVWSETSSVTHAAEGSDTELRLRITPLGASFVDRETRQSGPGEGLLSGLTPLGGCRDSVRIDVRLELSTADGLLAESVDAALEAYAADFASAFVRIDTSELAGSFDAAPVIPPNSVLQRSTLTIALGASAHGVAGELNVLSEFEAADGRAVGQSAGGAVAVFPADDYCGQPNAIAVDADVEVRGVSLAAALAAADPSGPLAVSYRSGEPSELELAIASDEARVCVSFDVDETYNGVVGGAIVRFPAQATLTSTDARIDGAFGVEVMAMSGGEALAVEVRAGQSSQDPVEAATLPPLFGIQDAIDFDGYNGGNVVFQLSASGETLTGALLVNGFDVAECAMNPSSPDPSGMGAPGCRGTDVLPLWGATW